MMKTPIMGAQAVCFFLIRNLDPADNRWGGVWAARPVVMGRARANSETPAHYYPREFRRLLRLYTEYGNRNAVFET
jgi:hypothetical protein